MRNTFRALGMRWPDRMCYKISRDTHRDPAEDDAKKNYVQKQPQRLIPAAGSEDTFHRAMAPSTNIWVTQLCAQLAHPLRCCSPLRSAVLRSNAGVWNPEQGPVEARVSLDQPQDFLCCLLLCVACLLRTNHPGVQLHQANDHREFR